MAIKIQHSKYRSPGIIFEALVRVITSHILEGKQESAALNVLKKYFNVNRELGKELQLYQACISTNRLTENRATQYLDIIISQRKKLNETKLIQEKYDLIKELKQHYDVEKLLSYQIPNYKLYASIYKTFLAETRHSNDTIINIQDVASARFSLLEHFLGHNKTAQKKESQLIESFQNQTEDLRLLTYKILIDKFNEKYSVLNDKQKVLLKEYINDVSNKNTLKTYIEKEVPVLQKDLNKRLASIKDKVTYIKLQEAISQLNTIGKKSTVRDSEISALIIAYEIQKSLEDLV